LKRFIYAQQAAGADFPIFIKDLRRAIDI